MVIYVLEAKLTAILDAIFNISKRSMMPEWHQLDSSSTMSKQQESAKKKKFKIKFQVMLFFYRTKRSVKEIPPWNGQ